MVQNKVSSPNTQILSFKLEPQTLNLNLDGSGPEISKLSSHKPQSNPKQQQSKPSQNSS